MQFFRHLPPLLILRAEDKARKLRRRLFCTLQPIHAGPEKQNRHREPREKKLQT